MFVEHREYCTNVSLGTWNWLKIPGRGPSHLLYSNWKKHQRVIRFSVLFFFLLLPFHYANWVFTASRSFVIRILIIIELNFRRKIEEKNKTEIRPCMVWIIVVVSKWTLLATRVHNIQSFVRPFRIEIMSMDELKATVNKYAMHHSVTTDEIPWLQLYGYLNFKLHISQKVIFR